MGDQLCGWCADALCMDLNLRVGLDRLVSSRVGGPVVTLAGTGVGYVALAWCGQQLMGQSSGVAAFWPPNGLVVALLVLLPSRLRPWVVAAVLPGELVADFLQGTPVLAALGWGAANSGEAVLAAGILLRLARRRPGGDAGRDFYALAVAAIAAPSVGGLLGGAVSYLTYGAPMAMPGLPGGSAMRQESCWSSRSFLPSHVRSSGRRQCGGLAGSSSLVSWSVSPLSCSARPGRRLSF